MHLTDWQPTPDERGNDATRLRPWTTGNAVTPLVHGARYFPALAQALADASRGDLLVFADWRGDPDELLADDGPTVAFSRAARRGALVKGLVWRSHLDRLRFSADQNRDLCRDINADGGEVLLDQRVRSLGSHHQKFVVVRHRADPARDVAFVGGIDLGHSRRDDAMHEGDRQVPPFACAYGGSPPGTTCRCASRGRRCCAPTRTAGPAIRSRRTASAAPRAGTPRRCGARAGWSTSRTSTCGRPTWHGSSPTPCAGVDCGRAPAVLRQSAGRLQAW